MGEALWIDIIHRVAVGERGEWLRIWLDSNADPGTKHPDSWTILSRAAAASSVNVVQIFVARNNIDVNVIDKTRKGPFSSAARNRHKEVVELLLGYADQY